MSNEVEREINRYLMHVASYLGSEEMVDEITMELRTHIEDRAQELAGEREVRAEDVWRAIHELGDPKEIAQGYLQESQIPSKIFISDDLYPYFLRTIGIVSVISIFLGIVWVFFGISRNSDIAGSILRIELSILASIGIIFVAFVFLSREGYTYESLRYKVETFFDARKVDLQELGDRYRTQQEQKREEKRLRQAWRRQREEEHRLELAKQREEKRWQRNIERQRKWERSVRPGQLGELFGAFFTIAIALFVLSPYAKVLEGKPLTPTMTVSSILKPAFLDDLRYVVVFLLIMAAMIHFATFVMGHTRSLYIARVVSSILELGFFVFLLTNITHYFYEIKIPRNDYVTTILANYDTLAVFLGFLILIKLLQMMWNTYKAASFPSSPNRRV